VNCSEMHPSISGDVTPRLEFDFYSYFGLHKNSYELSKPLPKPLIKKPKTTLSDWA
jgi:hypothetical protein